MQHNNWGKDRDILAEAVGKIFSEQHDLNSMRQFNYFLSQLSDMQKDLSLGDDTDSSIFQEIRHVAEQITTWCDDQQA